MIDLKKCAVLVVNGIYFGEEPFYKNVWKKMNDPEQLERYKYIMSAVKPEVSINVTTTPCTVPEEKFKEITKNIEAPTKGLMLASDLKAHQEYLHNSKLMEVCREADLKHEFDISKYETDTDTFIAAERKMQDIMKEVFDFQGGEPPDILPSTMAALVMLSSFDGNILLVGGTFEEDILLLGLQFSFMSRILEKIKKVYIVNDMSFFEDESDECKKNSYRSVESLGNLTDRLEIIQTKDL